MTFTLLLPTITMNYVGTVMQKADQKVDPVLGFASYGVQGDGICSRATEMRSR